MQNGMEYRSGPIGKLNVHLLRIHEKAQRVAVQFKTAEANLLTVIAEVDKYHIYQVLEFSSLFKYCVAPVSRHGLGLTEAVAFAMISVARVANHVPELKREVNEGNLSVFKAKKICSVLQGLSKEALRVSGEKKEETKKIVREWIEKAKSLPTEKLEREVFKFQTGGEDLEILKLKLTQSAFEKLKRVREVHSESVGREVSFEEAMTAMAEVFLEKKDKLRRAQRIIGKANDEPRGVQRAKEESRDSEEAKDELRESQKAEPQFIRTVEFRRTDKQTQVSRVLKKIQSSGGKNTPAQFIRTVRQDKAIPRHTLHELYLSKGGQCDERDAATGERCQNRHWLHAHHLKPRKEGGSHALENLTLLCSGHHRAMHRNAEQKT